MTNIPQLNAYIALIHTLLTCPSGQEAEILNANQSLLNKTLVQTMALVADKLLDRGHIEKAEFLINLGEELARSLGSTISAEEEEDVDEVSLTDRQEAYVYFLNQVLQIILDNPIDRQQLYRSFSENLDKLNEPLIQLLRLQETELLPNLERDSAIRIATAINIFSLYISEFTQENKAWSLEIAITGYEVSLNVITRESFPEYWAATQINLGNVYGDRIQGNRYENQEKAIRHYEAALEICTREGSAKEWAQIQNNLGATYQQRIQNDRAENLELAIAAYQNALTVYTPEVFPKDWARVQNNLGEAYRNRIRGDRAENLEKAIDCYQAALQVRTPSAFPSEWAATQDNLGIAYSQRLRGERAENLKLAIAACESALQVRTRSAFPQEWAITQNNLGIAYRDSGQLDAAVAAYQNALQVRTPEDSPFLWAQTQNNLGNVCRDRGQIASAIACYRAALTIRTVMLSPLECFTTASNLGHTAFLARHWAEAIEGYEIAIQALDPLRNWALTDRRRQQIQEAAINIYAGMVQAHIETGHPDRALEYIERSKARNLAERLANRNLYPKGDIPPPVLQELTRLRQEISTEQLRIDVTEWQNTESETRSRLHELQHQLDKLIEQQIRPLDPDFSLTQRVEPINLSEIQAFVRDRQTVLFEWYILRETFVTLIVTAENPLPLVWQSSSADLQALIDWANEYLRTYYERKTSWQNQLSLSLAQLAQILHFDEILSLIPSTCKKAILVPYRGLHLFPLHVLPLTDGSCLLDRFPDGVRYTPSCQLLQLAEKRQRPHFNSLFAIQNPNEDLDYTDIEIATIQRHFQTSHILAKSAACKTALQNEQLQAAHCLHFSCHGYFNLVQPLRSALLLADCYVSSSPVDPDPSKYLPTQDGKVISLNQCLTLDNIFTRDLPQCRLVALSACETGMTDFNSLSDEYIGLPSGFLIAGAASVVCSLWAVNDLSTAFLMIKFYENLRSGYSVAVALNRAQLWMRDVTKVEVEEWIKKNQLALNPSVRIILRRHFHKLPNKFQPFREPFYWAAFCAIGQ